MVPLASNRGGGGVMVLALGGWAELRDELKPAATSGSVLADVGEDLMMTAKAQKNLGFPIDLRVPMILKVGVLPMQTGIVRLMRRARERYRKEDRDGIIVKK